MQEIDKAKKEIEIQRTLNHPNIIKILDFTEELQPNPNIVKLEIIMEFAESKYIHY